MTDHTVHSITPGGPASDAEGKLLDMPRALAHSLNGELLDVLTLLHASMREADASGGEDDRDEDGITDASSRAVALIAMADDKVRGVLRAISRYV